jgi:zinc transport system permease protein
VVFGAISIATVFNLSNNMLLVLPVTVVSAILLLRTGKGARIKGDAAIAMISVGALAIGYLLLNLFSASSNLSGDVCSTLFGAFSILTLSQAEVWLSVGLSLLVVGLFVFFYHKIFAVTFDENFARATGVNAGAYNLLIAVIIAVIIVLAMNLVGSLLISALVIFPALSAMRVYKSFLSVTVCSAVVSVVCAVLGMLAAIVADTPVGSTIVAVDIAVFLIFVLAGKLKK